MSGYDPDRTFSPRHFQRCTQNGIASRQYCQTFSPTNWSWRPYVANSAEPAIAMNGSFTEAWCRMAGWLLPVFAGLSLSGCQVAHMALPQDLPSQSSELTVEGRQFSIFRDSIHFGPYHVTDIHRGWTRGEGFSISDSTSEYSSSEATQKYEFSVNESDRTTWKVRCATAADWSQLETQGFLGGGLAIEFSSNQQLVCTLKREGREKLSKLVMAQSASANQTALQGIMTDGATRIGISPTHKLDFTPLEVSTPTGYIFHIQGRPVGAVEVFNAGTVWLNNSVTPETRSALAATSAVLLLYQDIKNMSQ